MISPSPELFLQSLRGHVYTTERGGGVSYNRNPWNGHTLRRVPGLISKKLWKSEKSFNDYFLIQCCLLPYSVFLFSAYPFSYICPLHPGSEICCEEYFFPVFPFFFYNFFTRTRTIFVEHLHFNPRFSNLNDRPQKKIHPSLWIKQTGEGGSTYKQGHE